jgi:hypothetical protein
MAKNDKSGGYWRGDTWINISWGDKISESLANREKQTSPCKHCGVGMKHYNNITPKFCSPKCRYDALEGIERKATVLGANLLMGSGKKAWITENLIAVLDQPCRYCGDVLTLENVTIDHKAPYSSSKKRRNKSENKEHRRFMDRRENLQFICGPCNQLKGSLDENQFDRLLAFFSKNSDMSDYIRRRLMRGLVMFGRGRRAA